jgi:DNA-binding NtrC family response regulator
MDYPNADLVRRLRQSDALARLVGESPGFLRVLERLETIAASDATVLVEGDTGTGKELVARAIHYLSRRGALPFIPVNCGAIPDALIEDELFGHERGAFTDAQHQRIGLIGAAQGGTLCLDEVGSLPPRAQVVLLRVLQDKTFRSLGSTREEHADTRFIALSNTPLLDLVHRATFRGDLYYRLCVLSVHLPPLRERQEDILPLAFHFLRMHARAEKPVTAIAPRAQRLLQSHDWPGNVRQLENTILRAAQTAATNCVDLDDLDLLAPSPHRALVTDSSHVAGESLRLLKRRMVETFEHAYLTNLMRECRGNVTQAARVAGKERRDLGKLLRKYRIEPKTFLG